RILVWKLATCYCKRHCVVSNIDVVDDYFRGFVHFNGLHGFTAISCKQYPIFTYTNIADGLRSGTGAPFVGFKAWTSIKCGSVFNTDHFILKYGRVVWQDYIQCNLGNSIAAVGGIHPYKYLRAGGQIYKW